MPSYTDLLHFNEATRMYTWPKYADVKISDHFTTLELRCHCVFPDCNEQTISSELIDRLEKLRESGARPITVNSGYRCQKQQSYLLHAGYQATPGTSQHTLGQAADVSIQGMTGPEIEAAASQIFKSIGVAGNWAHLDTRDDKVRRWTY